ncbi:MAG: N-acetylmuramoyl-L-alanine amidase, partial [Muribaculaceae bacterium]|nr:N-acetylmuramoyl-L-alanine amidase [Muribaculaceae bacterium]
MDMNFTFNRHFRDRLIIFTIIILAFSGVTPLYAAPDYYRDYIDRYADLAGAGQRAPGIPAALTLAQGLLG